MNVGIIGASGYSGETLVAILADHPRARLTAVTSRQHAGKPVGDVMPSLRGRLADLTFTESDPNRVGQKGDVECWFLALPHGAAAAYARVLVAAGRRVIDLSADFRLRDPALYKAYYGHDHPAPELLTRSSYVLPELAGDSWKSLPLLAAPGCYPTSILLPLVPLLRLGLVEATPGRVVVNSLSGVSGAGRKLEETYLFCERAESVKAYGIPRHRHLSEIEEQLALAAGTAVTLQFTPHLAPMRRGIATTIVAPVRAGVTGDQIREVWRSVYSGRRFVHVLAEGETPDTVHVVGTNRADLGACVDPRTGNAVLTSAIDNLVKGAAGQAVQILNLWMGWPEGEGLT